MEDSPLTTAEFLAMVAGDIVLVIGWDLRKAKIDWL